MRYAELQKNQPRLAKQLRERFISTKTGQFDLYMPFIITGNPPALLGGSQSLTVAVIGKPIARRVVLPRLREAGSLQRLDLIHVVVSIVFRLRQACQRGSGGCLTHNIRDTYNNFIDLPLHHSPPFLRTCLAQSDWDRPPHNWNIGKVHNEIGS